MPNGLENRISFAINSKLSFINSFQFLSSSLDNLVKNLNKCFKFLSQEFDNNVLDLVEQKEYYPYKYMTDFEKFMEGFHRGEGIVTNKYKGNFFTLSVVYLLYACNGRGCCRFKEPSHKE